MHNESDISPFLTVVVPVFNEQESLPTLLELLLPYCLRNRFQVIFVDDGSSDSSGPILDKSCKEASVRVIHHKVNRGYGGAIKTGIQAVQTPFLITIDADGQHSIEDIEIMLQEMQQTGADLLIGNRGKYNANRFRALGKWIIRTFAGFLMSIPVTDLNSGFKLYRTDLAQQYMRLCPDTMAFSDIITLIFINEKNLVREIPITIHARKAGKSTINIYTAIDTVAEIVNITVLFNPGRIFYPISVMCLLFGVIWAIPFLLMGRGMSIGAMLAIVTGLLFFAIGLIAQQLSAIQKHALERRNSDEK